MLFKFDAAAALCYRTGKDRGGTARSSIVVAAFMRWWFCVIWWRLLCGHGPVQSDRGFYAAGFLHSPVEAGNCLRHCLRWAVCDLVGNSAQSGRGGTADNKISGHRVASACYQLLLIDYCVDQTTQSVVDVCSNIKCE